MNKIKVYIQYPWKSADSSYYKNIINFPPEEIVFVNFKQNDKKVKGIESSKKFERTRILKNILRKILTMIQIPNLTHTKRGKYDLIHCAHCLSINKKPWIVDTETYDRVASFGKIAESKIGKRIIRNRLESENCKKIICWSEACKKTFEESFPNNKKILNKIEIVHFGLPEIKFKKINKRKNLRILFVARWFDAKGGRQTLEVFDRLSKKYPSIEFTFICPTPKEFKKKYLGNKQIKIIDLLPQKELFSKIYPSSDIFFYPGFGDSYGFAIPEALRFGLPVITSKTFAKNELVEEGKTGFLIKQPSDWKDYTNMNESMLNEYVDKTSKLIEYKSLREKMSEAAKKSAKEKFSIKERNKKLEKIYREAI